MPNHIAEKFPTIPKRIDVEHLCDEDGINTVGYYALGFWDKRSVAIAANQTYGIKPKLTAKSFKHLYIRKLIASIEIAKYEIVITNSNDERAMKATYCEL